MWQGVPFLITEWVKCNIGKTIPDADGDNIPIIGQDALQTTSNLDRLVIHIILVPFKLARRMYGFSLPSVCILMQDCNNRSMLGHNNSPSCHNGNIGDLMIVNATNINCLIRFLNVTNIITSNATIGSSINK